MLRPFGLVSFFKGSKGLIGWKGTLPSRRTFSLLRSTRVAPIAPFHFHIVQKHPSPFFFAFKKGFSSETEKEISQEPENFEENATKPSETNQAPPFTKEDVINFFLKLDAKAQEEVYFRIGTARLLAPKDIQIGNAFTEALGVREVPEKVPDTFDEEQIETNFGKVFFSLLLGGAILFGVIFTIRLIRNMTPSVTNSIEVLSVDMGFVVYVAFQTVVPFLTMEPNMSEFLGKPVRIDESTVKTMVDQRSAIITFPVFGRTRRGICNIELSHSFFGVWKIDVAMLDMSTGERRIIEIPDELKYIEGKKTEDINELHRRSVALFESGKADSSGENPP